MTGYRQRIYASYGKTIQSVVGTFDEESARRWGAARDWYLRGWLPQDKDAQIADLACGGGKLLFFFDSKGYKNIRGVDISPYQIDLSLQVTPHVVQAEATAFLEENPGEFDLITGFDIIEHLYKDEALRFLDAAYRALRIGGRLILQTPNADSPWAAQLRYGDFTHEVAFSPNALERLLRLVGLTDIERRECDPPPFGYSIASTLRSALWQVIRLGLSACTLIETGATGDGVWTRVFLASGVRRG